MGETIFYMRSSSPGGIVPPLNDQVIEDLEAFAEVSDSDFEEILTELGKEAAFLSREALKASVRKVLPEGIAKQITRTIRHLHSMETEGPGADKIVRQLTTVESVDDDNTEPTFSEEKRDLLLSRLAALKKSWGSLDRQKKAEAIGKVTGQRLLDIQLICDLRPVFNEQREGVEGWIPLTTMHVATEGADGLPNGIDIVMSAVEVDNLVELASAAKRKLRVLREHVTRSNGRIPETDITAHE